MKNVLSLGLAAAALCVVGDKAFAESPTLSAVTLKATGEPYSKVIVDKLFVFKVGAACAARLGDENGGAAHVAPFLTRDIAKLAKNMTGDDWVAFENADKEKNGPVVAAQIEAFRSKFSLTIEIEGDDCDNSFSAPWTGYLTAAVTAALNYDNKLPKLHIAFHAKKSLRGITYTVTPDGSNVDYVVSRDVTPPDWGNVIDKPFRQRLSGFASDVSYALMLSADPIRARAFDRLVTLKVGPACKTKLALKDGGGIHSFGFVASDLAAIGQAATGDDWDSIAQQNGGYQGAGFATATGMIDDFKNRFNFTVSIEGADCDNTMNALWQRYLTTLSRAMRENPPTAKKISIELKIVGKAKDLKITASKDGGKISIIAPAAVEPKAWDDRLKAPFAKFPRNSH
jgi:peptidoglycan hydrolase-like protein with peptidoglycan-binding domain